MPIVGDGRSGLPPPDAESVRSVFFLSQDPVHDLGHVLRCVEYVTSDVDGSFGLHCQRYRVARACIDLDEFSADLVVHLELEPCEECAVHHVVDEHTFEGDVETLQHETDQIMGEWALFADAFTGHPDGFACEGVNVNYDGFFLVAEK